MNEVMTMNDMLNNLDGIVDGIAKKYESNPEKDLLCEKYLEELDGLRHTLRNRCISIPKIKSVIDHGRHTWALDEDGICHIVLAKNYIGGEYVYGQSMGSASLF